MNKPPNRVSPILAIILIVLCAVAMNGCSDAQFEQMKMQVAEAQEKMNIAKAEFDALADERKVLQDALDAAMAAAPEDPDAKAAWQAEVEKMREKFAKINNGLDAAQAKVDEYTGTLNGLAESIKNAKTGEDALAEAIKTGSAIVSTATGNPLPTVIGSIIASAVTFFGTRKRLQLAGAAKVAAGVEAARSDKLEAENPGFIVFEKAGAAISHHAAGVDTAIKMAT